jgi:hypothetical protein
VEIYSLRLYPIIEDIFTTIHHVQGDFVHRLVQNGTLKFLEQRPHGCGLSNPFILEKKNHLNKTIKSLSLSTKSMSHLSPEYLTIDLIIAIF